MGFGAGAGAGAATGLALPGWVPFAWGVGRLVLAGFLGKSAPKPEPIREWRFPQAGQGLTVVRQLGRGRIECLDLWKGRMRAEAIEKSFFKGLFGPQTVGYEYFYTGGKVISWQGETPAAGFVRLYVEGDQELIIDLSKSGPLGSVAVGGGFHPNIRYFPGRLAERPDPAMTEILGADRALAYPGLAHLVFDNFQIKGSTIPSASIEQFQAGGPAYPKTVVDMASAAVDFAVQNPEANWAYFGTNTATFVRVNLADPDRFETIATGLPAGVTSEWVGGAFGANGDFYTCLNQAGQSWALALLRNGRFLAATQSTANNGVLTLAGVACCVLGSGDVLAISTDDAYIVAGSPGGGTQNDYGVPLLDVLGTHDTDGLTGATVANADCVTDGEGTGWVLAHSGSDVFLLAFDPLTGNPAGVTTIAGEGGANEYALTYCPVTNSLIFARDVGVTNRVYRFGLDSMTLEAQADITWAHLENRAIFNNPTTPQGTIFIGKTEYDVTDLSALRTVDRADYGLPLNGTCFYDPVSHALVCEEDADTSKKDWMYLDRVAGANTDLAAVLDFHAGEAGYLASDHDFAEHAGTSVHEELIRAIQPGHQIVEALQPHFRIDLTQEQRGAGGADGLKLVAVARHTTPLETVDISELGLAPGGSAADFDLAFEVAPPVLAPRSVEVEAMSPAENYQQRSEIYARDDAGVQHGKDIKIDLTQLALEEDEHIRTAERIAWDLEDNRTPVRFTGPPRARAWTPGTVIAVTADPLTHLLRIHQQDLSQGVPSFQARAISSIGSDLSGQPNLGFQDKEIASLGAPEMFLVDGPLLRIADDGIYGLLYVMFAPFFGDKNPGMLLETADSEDGPFTAVLQIPGSAAVTWGTIESALGAVENPLDIDNTNDLIVRLQHGSGLADALDDADFFGTLQTNFAIRQRFDGRVEYLKFKTAALQADGTYLCETLLRGLGNTRNFTGGGLAGERIFFPQPGTVFPVKVDLSRVGTEATPKLTWWRGATIRGGPNSTVTRSINFLAKSRWPAPPLHFGTAAITSSARRNRACTREGDNDLSGLFSRESRWWNGLLNELPIAETTLAFHFEVYDSAARTNKVRDLTMSATVAGSVISKDDNDPHNQSFLYKAADQTTDGFDHSETQLFLRVFQVSDEVGDGEPHDITLDIVA